MSRHKQFLRKTSNSDIISSDDPLIKNTNNKGDSFLKSEQQKARSIARETITIHTGNQLIKAMNEVNIESNKTKPERKPSKLPLLKRDSTYIVSPSSNAIKNVTGHNHETAPNKLAPVVPKSEPNPKMIQNKFIPRKPMIRKNSEKTADVDSSIENNQPENVQMPKIKSLSSFKQQKRNEIKRLNEKSYFADNFEMPEVNMIGNKSIETIVDNARKSGHLNLSDFGLTESKLTCYFLI